VVASVLGVVAGVGLAIGLRDLLARAGLGLPSTAPVISATTVISSLVVGVLVTLVAALFPARRAASVAPIAAMRQVAVDVSNRSRVRLLAGLLLTVGGLAELYQGLFTATGSRLPHVGVGAFLIFVGVAVLGPSFAAPVSRVLGTPLAALGVTGRLARENAIRNPKRTSATASALMIGVGLIVFFAVAGQSIKASASQAIDKTVTGDFVIDSQTFNGGFNPSLNRQVQALPEVQTSTGIRFGVAKVDHSGTVVLAVDPTSFTQIVKLPVVAGSFDQLGAHDVAIPEALAKDKHWAVGSMIPATFTGASTGPVSTLLRVAVIYQATLPGQGRYLMSLAGFDTYFPVNQQVDNQIYVKLKPGADAEAARRAMTVLAKPYPTAKVEDLQTFKKAQLSQIDQLLTIVTLLLALSLLIALIGVVNTLLLSVYERTREIGLLRAVGETRRQLRRSVSEESVIITLLGTVLGLVIGMAFAWALIRALADQHLNVFSIPVGQLVEFVVAAVIVGVLAALYPAWRASRLDVLEAIATD
jgi:putative ABC transport system permease protein